MHLALTPPDACVISFCTIYAPKSDEIVVK